MNKQEQLVAEFKLYGLNRKQKTGVYATVNLANEDWFHADFDEALFPIDRQYALFDYFKNGDDNIWKDNKNAKVVVRFDGWSTGNVPINPIIIDIKNIQ
jgi:hypothetical protein